MLRFHEVMGLKCLETIIKIKLYIIVFKGRISILHYACKCMLKIHLNWPDEYKKNLIFKPHFNVKQSLH